MNSIHKVKSLDELDQTIQYIVQLHSIIKRYELLVEYLLEQQIVLSDDAPLRTQLKALERGIIKDVLSRTKNQSQAARLLGMERNTLIGKIAALGLNKDKANAG